jgi:lipoprotein-releasing system permease protein
MKNFSLMLALRYLWSANRDTSIATMMRICFIGIFLGTVALTLVFCVMHGFELATQEKLQSIHPSIMIYSDEPLHYNKIKTVLNKEFPQIMATAPTSQQFASIKIGKNQNLNNVIALKGIDPQKEGTVTVIEQKIIEPENSSFESLLKNNQILVGKKLAEQFDLEIGDPLTVIYVEENKNKLAEETFEVSGIFHVGIEDFDAKLGLISLETFKELFPTKGITEIGLKLKKNVNEQAILNEMKDRFALDIVSWHELYPAIVSALKLEKYAMFFVIALIILVASMNIISLLFMQITQKRSNIAILRANGLPFKKIRSIFLWIGLCIGLGSSLTGLTVAYLIGLLLKTYPFVKLPDVYYTTHLPIVMEPFTFVMIFIVVMLLVFFATLISLQNLKKINIAEILRFEG